MTRGMEREREKITKTKSILGEKFLVRNGEKMEEGRKHQALLGYFSNVNERAFFVAKRNMGKLVNLRKKVRANLSENYNEWATRFRRF